jgi:Tol biopolymer transport system component
MTADLGENSVKKAVSALLFAVPLVTLIPLRGTAYLRGPVDLPNWSVKELAVEVGYGLAEQIVIVDPKISKPRHLTDGLNPVWSPDGGQIAYCVHLGPRSFGQIQVINVDGSGQKKLTNVKGGACLPDWSPDGEKLAFTAYNKGPLVSIVDKDGENVRSITEGYGARWSPDGTRLVFCRNPQGHKTSGSIWIINVDGTGLKQIIEDDSDALEPTWFPDGNSVAFASEREHSKISAIFRVNLDGTGLEKIAGDQKLALFFPVISPDGKLLIVDCIPAHSHGRLVVLLNTAGNQGTALAQGVHPSVLWEKR